MGLDICRVSLQKLIVISNNDLVPSLFEVLIQYFPYSVNASLEAACDRVGSCSEMGINAVGINGMPRANGPYFVLTTDKKPYCRKSR